MGEIFNHIDVDISKIGWGRSPVPLMPKSLRHEWSTEILPAWLVSEAHLPTGSTIEVLGPSFWSFTIEINARIQHFVRFFVDSRLQSIRPLRCFVRPWPAGLRIDSIPFGTRSRHLLKLHGYIENPRILVDLSFGRLLDIPGLGVKSLLEITTLIETAMEIHDRISSSLSQSANSGQAATPEANAASRDGSTTVLLNILQESWVDLISDQDPRFSSLLSAGRGTLEERIDRCIADPNSAAIEAPALLKSINEIRQVVSRIESQSLESGLLDLLAAALRTNDQSRLDAMAMRLGWAGAAPRTLQECGEYLGITRERIRQIESKVARRLPKHPVFMPKLDQALNLLEKSVPVDLDEAARLLEQNQISQKPFSPISLIDAARLLGHKTTLTVQHIRGTQVVVGGENVEGLGDVVRIARKLAGQAGVASIFQVSDGLLSLRESKSTDAKQPIIKEDDIRRLLKNIPECEFLNNEDWFWFTDIPQGRNRLCNIANRILSVASPQSIASIREGIRRAFRFRSLSQPRYRSLTVPPLVAIEQFFHRHPEYRIDGDQVGSVNRLDYQQLLGETEQTFVDVFRSSPSHVLDRKTMIEACIERGINENTLSMYTTYSPILEHLGIDIWKLRGVIADPTAVEALREQNHLRFRETRLLEYGWTPEGKLWVAWKIPSMVGGVVFGVPGAVRRYLVDQTFSANAKETTRPCGQIAINEQGSSYGYTSFLRYAGADIGDVLLTEFDLAQHTVELAIADVEILEQYQ